MAAGVFATFGFSAVTTVIVMRQVFDSVLSGHWILSIGFATSHLSPNWRTDFTHCF
jgi:hypothetical protein